eukprot:353120-Chlamydomonas_euryale.AAC.11
MGTVSGDCSMLVCATRGEGGDVLIRLCYASGACGVFKACCMTSEFHATVGDWAPGRTGAASP